MPPTNPKIRKYIDEELFPNEPVLWEGRPGGKFLTTGGKLFLGLFWLVLPIGFYMDSEEPVNHFQIWGLILGLTAFLFLIDRMTRRNTLYVITDRRILIGAKDEDGDLMVRTLTLSAETKVWHAKRWNAIHIHTPTKREGFLADMWNRLRINGFTFNDVEDPENVFKMIQKIITQQK